MSRQPTRLTLALTASAALLAAPALAQTPVPAAPAPGAGNRDGGAVSGTLPDWSIRNEIESLDDSVQKYNRLIDTLSSASNKLDESFAEYLKDPKNRVKQSVVEKKLAEYAAEVTGRFNDVIADQDLLGANFRDLRRKLGSFSGYLDNRAKDYSRQLVGYRQEAKDVEKELIELSVTLKENPPQDPRELSRMKREFKKVLARYKLKARYVSNYTRHFKSYQQLSGNVDKLSGLFVNLHDKFNELVENLEDEQRFLRDSIRLQADTLRIRQLISQGMFGSEKALGNVADKLARLYAEIDGFNKVHDRISQDLTGFMESQGTLLDLSDRISKIGDVGGEGLGELNADIEKAIDAFYEKRDADPEDGLVLDQLKKDQAEQAAEKAAETPAPSNQTPSPVPGAGQE